MFSESWVSGGTGTCVCHMGCVCHVGRVWEQPLPRQSLTARLQILPLSIPSSATLGKTLHFSVPRFPCV